jgi:adenine-specific DNA glycosylase
VERALALIVRRGRWLMVPREGRLLEGLWEPPTVEMERATKDGGRAALRRRLNELGLSARLVRTGTLVRHVLSHRDFRTRMWRATVESPVPRSRQFRFIEPTKPGVPVTGLVKRLLAELRVSPR